MRLGIRVVCGMSELHGRAIPERRAEGTFASYRDFVARTRLPTNVVSVLARVDAFRLLTDSRLGAVWESMHSRERVRLFDHLKDFEAKAPSPGISDHDEIVASYKTARLSLNAHPARLPKIP